MLMLKEKLLACKSRLHKTPYKEFFADLQSVGEIMKQGIKETGSVLFRSRRMSRYVISLAGLYILTGDDSYAAGACAIVDEALSWRCWYSEANEQLPLDLSVGEMAFTLAIAMELLDTYMGEARLSRVKEEAMKRILIPYEKAVCRAEQDRPWWYSTHINWNPVVNGGIYCLALLFAQESEIARRIVPLMLVALDRYTDAIHADGSSEEGIGYWFYGMLYQSYAMAAYENAAGKTARFFLHPAVKNGMDFPFDFSPDGAGCSFGDINWFWPTGGMYILAEKAGRTDIAGKITKRLLLCREKFRNDMVFKAESCYMWPSEVFGLAFCNEATAEGADVCKSNVRDPDGLKVYPDNGWGLLRRGDMSLSLRSGNSRVNHGAKNLQSVQLVKAGVKMIEDFPNHPYPDGWFGETRVCFLEDMPLSKSTMFVNGVGQLDHATAVFGYDKNEMWSEIAHAYLPFCQRIERRISLSPRGLQIEDRFVTDAAKKQVWHEIRFTSYGCFAEEGDGCWSLEKDGETVLLHFSSNRALVFDIVKLPNSIGVRPSVYALRCVTKEPSCDTTLHTEIVSISSCGRQSQLGLSTQGKSS